MAGRFSLRLSLLAVIALPYGPAVAQTPPLGLCRVSEVNGKAYLPPANYIRWALGVHPVSPHTLDADQDGAESFAEKRAILLRPEEATTRAAAVPEDFRKRDSDNIGKAVSWLKDFLDAAATDSRYPYRTVWLAGLGEGDRSDERPLRMDDALRKEKLSVLFRWYLGDEGSPPRIGIECVKADKPALLATRREQQKEVPLINRAARAIRVRKSNDKLWLARADASATDAATLSITRNIKRRESILTLDGSVGLSFQTLRLTDALSPFDDIIPFVEFHRRFQIGRNRRPDDIDNLTAGVQASILLHSPTFESIFETFGIRRNDFGMNALIEFTPTYTTDTQTGAKVGDLELSIKPSFDFAGKFRIAPNWLPLPYTRGEFGLYRIVPAIRLSAGKVFDNGGSTILDDKEEYLRFGGSINAAWSGPPGTLFEKLELSIEYKYLRGLRSRPQEIRWLRAAAAYRITEWASLNFQYVWGDEDKTFQRQNFWEFQVGILF